MTPFDITVNRFVTFYSLFTFKGVNMRSCIQYALCSPWPKDWDSQNSGRRLRIMFTVLKNLQSDYFIIIFLLLLLLLFLHQTCPWQKKWKFFLKESHKTQQLKFLLLKGQRPCCSRLNNFLWQAKSWLILLFQPPTHTHTHSCTPRTYFAYLSSLLVHSHVQIGTGVNPHLHLCVGEYPLGELYSCVCAHSHFWPFQTDCFLSLAVGDHL